jgi:amino acid transporter
MKILTLILSILAIGLVIFNSTKLNFEALLEGESFTSVITIIVSLCALVLLQILRISKKIEKLDKAR